MSAFVLDRAFFVEEPDGIERHRAVVRGVGPDHCRLPDSVNAAEVLGITTHTQTRQGRAITVRRMGLGPWEAAEAFPVGAHLCIDGDDGRARATRNPRALVGTESVNGAVRFISRRPAATNHLVTIDVDAIGSESELVITIQGAQIAIALQTDALSEPETTALEVVEAINSHPVASLLVRAELAGGDGSAVCATGEAEFIGHEESINVVAIAQQSSTGPGDVVDVLIMP